MAIDINDRFIKAMEHLGHTGYSFSKKLGTSEAVISNIRKKKNPPNIILVQKLLNMYLDINPDWLLHGRGEMMRNGVADPEIDTEQFGMEGALNELTKKINALEKSMKAGN